MVAQHSTTCIVPVEFMTLENCEAAETALAHHFPSAEGEGELYVYRRLSGDPRSYYRADINGAQVRVIFDDTSACVIVRIAPREFTQTAHAVASATQQRSVLNSQLIARKRENPIFHILKVMEESAMTAIVPTWPTYVFSFSIVQVREPQALDAYDNICKILAEPSLIGSDDLIPRREAALVNLQQIDRGAIDAIADCDLAHHSRTFITWATIVCLTSARGEQFSETRALIEGLEIRMQMVWNRCHAMSKMIEKIIDTRDHSVDTEEVLVNFARAADDARSVLSSTISTRGQEMFNEMIRTSRVTSEVTRLEKKIGLMDRYVSRLRSIRQYKYARTVEMFLFAIAAVSVIQLISGLPIISLSKSNSLYASLAIIIGFIFIGYFLIIRRPK